MRNAHGRGCRIWGRRSSPEWPSGSGANLHSCTTIREKSDSKLAPPSISARSRAFDLSGPRSPGLALDGGVIARLGWNHTVLKGRVHGGTMPQGEARVAGRSTSAQISFFLFFFWCSGEHSVDRRDPRPPDRRKNRTPGGNALRTGRMAASFFIYFLNHIYIPEKGPKSTTVHTK